MKIVFAHLLWRRASARNVSYCLPHGVYYPHRHSVDTPVCLPQCRRSYLVLLKAGITLFVSHEAQFTGIVCCCNLLPFIVMLSRYASDFPSVSSPGQVFPTRYLRCPSAVTVGVLKKFLLLKFTIPPTHQVAGTGRAQKLYALFWITSSALLFSKQC